MTQAVLRGVSLHRGAGDLAVDANGFVGGSNFTTIAQVIGVTAAGLFDAGNFLQ